MTLGLRILLLVNFLWLNAIPNYSTAQIHYIDETNFSDWYKKYAQATAGNIPFDSIQVNRILTKDGKNVTGEIVGDSAQCAKVGFNCSYFSCICLDGILDGHFEFSYPKDNSPKELYVRWRRIYDFGKCVSSERYNSNETLHRAWYFDHENGICYEKLWHDNQKLKWDVYAFEKEGYLNSWGKTYDEDGNLKHDSGYGVDTIYFIDYHRKSKVIYRKLIVTASTWERGSYNSDGSLHEYITGNGHNLKETALLSLKTNDFSNPNLNPILDFCGEIKDGGKECGKFKIVDSELVKSGEWITYDSYGRVISKKQHN